jgi:hypothetical protein
MVDRSRVRRVTVAGVDTIERNSPLNQAGGNDRLQKIASIASVGLNADFRNNIGP